MIVLSTLILGCLIKLEGLVNGRLKSRRVINPVRSQRYVIYLCKYDFSVVR